MEYKNLAICDLRGISDIQTVKEIKEIHNVAMLILPKTENAELNNALSNIPQRNVAATFRLETDEELLIKNGTAMLYDGDFSDNEKQITIINGMACIMDISPEKHPRLIVNGPLYLREAVAQKANITCLMHNGSKHVVDFDNLKAVEESGVIDAEMLRWLKPKTLLSYGETATIADDVTAEMLDEKLTMIIAGENIICPSAVAGWVHAKGEAGEKIIVK